MSDLAKTALYDWHVAHGAKMVGFAGYAMPVQYAEGIVKEHQWTREHAGLFDVSHMGQILVTGNEVPAALEALLPIDAQGLAIGQQRYALLMNKQGTIDDDLMVTRRSDDFYLVVNAACKVADFAYLQENINNFIVTKGIDYAFANDALNQGVDSLDKMYHEAKSWRCEVRWWDERSLLALQGPEAVAVLGELNPAVAELGFMRGGEFELLGASCWISRSGYTGEDGFELSVPNEIAVALADKLVADERVKPIGLGARDSLRLEAGLCLYGNDIDTTTTPIEAGLLWAIQKVRRPDGERAGGYPGADVIAEQIEKGTPRKRVGLRIDGRVPVRAGAEIKDLDGKIVGKVTSGGFGATVNAPVAMAYLDSDMADASLDDLFPDDLFAMVRNKAIKVTVAPLPFVKKDYKK